MPKGIRIDRDKVCQLYKEGRFQSQIAKTLGVSLGSVNKACQELGLKSRYKVVPEEKLHKAEDLIKKGESVTKACRAAGISPAHLYRYGNIEDHPNRRASRKLKVFEKLHPLLQLLESERREQSLSCAQFSQNMGMRSSWWLAFLYRTSCNHVLKRLDMVCEELGYELSIKRIRNPGA